MELAPRVHAMPPGGKKVIGELFPQLHRCMLHSVPPRQVDTVVPSEQSASVSAVIAELEALCKNAGYEETSRSVSSLNVLCVPPVIIDIVVYNEKRLKRKQDHFIKTRTIKIFF